MDPKWTTAERGLFAEFLEEAAILLDQPKLAPSAKRFREIAPCWRSLAGAALPDRIPILRETRDLLLQQRDLYLEQGQAANAAGENSVHNSKTMQKSLPPHSTLRAKIRRLKQDRILHSSSGKALYR